ncbi:MAG: 3'-5' exonuclease, partial [Gemmataceae bacterium]
MNIAADIIARRSSRAATASTGFLIFDTESVPDGRLIARSLYPHERLSPEQAIERARAEAKASSREGSDFLPVTYQIPVAVCVIRVGTDFTLQRIACLGAPNYEPATIARQFWRGVEYYSHAKLVTFNGRAFDLPLLELAAYDHRLMAPQHFARNRNRFHGQHIDLMDWL